MRIVLISDTHGMHQHVKVPDGDLLIHAGDFTNVGTLPQIIDFNWWLGELPHTHKVLIAGNHDLSMHFRRPEVVEPLLTNCTYLKNSGCEIEGLKLWGSPYTPKFGSGWAFQLDRMDSTFWDQIPGDTDLLITHGPPMHVLDETLEGDFAGCPFLKKAVQRVRPKLHVFGHIHEGYGTEGNSYNASICTRDYRPVNKPWKVDL